MVIYLWYKGIIKHKESPKPSDKSFPRCNNFAASEMRFRRAKALPTCENSRKKPATRWLVVSKSSRFIFRSHFIWKHPTKKSGERKKYLKNLCLKPTTYRRWIRAPHFKKNHNNKKIGLWKDGFRKDMMLKSFSCFFCKTCVFILLKPVWRNISSIWFFHFLFLNETAVDGLTNGPPKSRNPLFSGYIPYESEIRIWIQTYFPLSTPQGWCSLRTSAQSIIRKSQRSWHTWKER